MEAEKAAARVLWKSNQETRQGSESHDLGINGLSTARGILQRFQEACQSTKRDADTRHPAGNWNLAIQDHSQRFLLEFLTRPALFQPLLKGLDDTFLMNADKIVSRLRKPLFSFLLRQIITHKKVKEQSSKATNQSKPLSKPLIKLRLRPLDEMVASVVVIISTLCTIVCT